MNFYDSWWYCLSVSQKCNKLLQKYNFHMPLTSARVDLQSEIEIIAWTKLDYHFDAGAPNFFVN